MNAIISVEFTLLVKLFSNTQLAKALLVTAFTTCILTGCAGQALVATPYKAAQSPGGEGYTSHRLSESKYKITYKANEATTAQQLADYAHQRATELTLTKGFSWYRVISAKSVMLPGMDEQQIMTAAPQQNTVDGAATGDVNTTALPKNQQCSVSGCEQVTAPEPVGAVSTMDTGPAKYYTMTIQLGHHEPAPEQAIVVD
ncbi:CC0125/CC1285 family lipoprotein [Alteromonas gilva]|uniref:Lipoprotein n=1 Tax=Alteromonas gilva TaxID=2987522 RepID=A0ABT5L0Z9_9ALTE|nr:hypothetical protein [Alteromonas gilva]MDC8830700.1 hypothetical protein [Alteromonas gilva]